MVINDCFGVSAQVGDVISYSIGNSGAKTWKTSTISKISDKCIYFQGSPGSNWRHGEIVELRRTQGCFVINTYKRGG